MDANLREGYLNQSFACLRSHWIPQLHSCSRKPKLQLKPQPRQITFSSESRRSDHDTEGGRTIDAEDQGGTKFGKRKGKSVVVQPRKRLKSGKANGKDIQRAQEGDHDPEPEAPPILDRNAETIPDSTGVAAEEQSTSLVDEEPRMKPKPKRKSGGQSASNRSFVKKGKRNLQALSISSARKQEAV